MSIQVIASGIQTRIRDCYVPAPNVDLTLRCNGEEPTQIIDALGNLRPAGIESPTVLPACATGGAGNLPFAQWVGYVYVYAATTRYPQVANAVTAGGSIAPRSNPSPNLVFQVPTTSGGNSNINVTVTYTLRTDIDAIWIYRTAFFTTQVLAQAAADAGQLFYLDSIQNQNVTGTATYLDSIANNSAGEQAEFDNYLGPTFQFACYDGTYFWGIGNFSYITTITLSSTGGLTLSGTDTWFSGRNGQLVSLYGITTGGFDNAGSYYFKQVTPTTGQLYLDEALTELGSVTVTGTTQIRIQGPSTTLYRSKPNNPLSWGFTDSVGTDLVPQEYAFKVGGGQGSAIAVMPNLYLLKIDTIEPARCYTLNLKVAGTDAFNVSLRTVSEKYSVTCHWSQFVATMSNKQQVLWGYDSNNFAILQSDGITQLAIGDEIFVDLRDVALIDRQQLSACGIYDSRTELNCMWITTSAAGTAGGLINNLLVYQHSPSGVWGRKIDFETSSVTRIENSNTFQVDTFIGTQRGVIAKAFNVLGKPAIQYGFPIQELLETSVGPFYGVILSATSTSITVATNTFPSTLVSLDNSWVLVTDANDYNEIWCRIISHTTNSLTLDYCYYFASDYDQFISANGFVTPIPIAGWKFYVGVIESIVYKGFSFMIPAATKKWLEIWITILNANQQNEPTSFNSANPLVNVWQDWDPLVNDITPTRIDLERVSRPDGNLSQVWFKKSGIGFDNTRAYIMSIIDRGYGNFRLMDATIVMDKLGGDD